MEIWARAFVPAKQRMAIRRTAENRAWLVAGKSIPIKEHRSAKEIIAATRHTCAVRRVPHMCVRPAGGLMVASPTRREYPQPSNRLHMKKLAPLAIAFLLAAPLAHASKSAANESPAPVIGRIAFISDSKITLKVKEQPLTVAFTITDATKVEINGEEASFRALKFDWKVEVTPTTGEPSVAQKIVKLPPGS